MADSLTMDDTELEEADDNLEEDTALDADADDESLLDDSDEDSDEDTSREEQRRKSAAGQIKKAQALLDAGKKLPESLKWTLPQLDKPKGQTDPKSVKAESLEELVEKKLAEKEDAKLFSQKAEEYKKLPKELRARAKAEFEYFVAKGFQKGEALAKILSLVSVKSDSEDTQRKKMLAAVPNPSGKSGETIDASNYENLNEKDQLKVLKHLVGIR
jgi:hypothetical protein